MRMREIQGFPGYFICEDGGVWSSPKPPANPGGKLLVPKIDKDGYWNYALRRNRKLLETRSSSQVSRIKHRKQRCID